MDLTQKEFEDGITKLECSIQVEEIKKKEHELIVMYFDDEIDKAEFHKTAIYYKKQIEEITKKFNELS